MILTVSFCIYCVKIPYWDRRPTRGDATGTCLERDRPGRRYSAAAAASHVRAGERVAGSRAVCIVQSLAAVRAGRFLVSFDVFVVCAVRRLHNLFVSRSFVIHNILHIPCDGIYCCRFVRFSRMCDRFRSCGFRVSIVGPVVVGNEYLHRYGGLVFREQRGAAGRGAAVPKAVEENRSEIVPSTFAHRQSA